MELLCWSQHVVAYRDIHLFAIRDPENPPHGVKLEKRGDRDDIVNAIER